MSEGPARPARPGYGGFGLCNCVGANHFPVIVLNRDFTQYNVLISPEMGSKRVRRDIIKQVVATSNLGNRLLAYDGNKTCYTAGALPFKSKLFHIKILDICSRKEREFDVSIKFASKLDLDQLRNFIQGREDEPHETIRLLNVVLAQNHHSDGYTMVGRSFFAPNRSSSFKEEIGNGVEYRKGFYQSLRPTQMGLSLIIDTSAAAFYQNIEVMNYVEKCINRDVHELSHPLHDKDHLSLNKSLKGVTVETRLGVDYIRRRHKVLGLTKQSCQELRFAMEGTGNEISLAQYFLDKYGEYTINYPHLPALEVVNQYDDTKPYYLPMELCKIVEGQRYSQKLNETQLNALLKATCKNPEKREISIMKIVAKNNFNQDLLVNKEFGIQVKDKELTYINGRKLPSPKVVYHGDGKESVVSPQDGKWNMMDNKMIDGGNVELWTCVNFSKLSIEKVEKFCNDVIEMCITKGMVCSRQPLVPIRNAQPCAVRKALFNVDAESRSQLEKLDTATGKRLQLLIVVLHERSDIYGKIKRVCETELGIVSQCFHPKNIEKTGKQYRQCIGNVALKINAKVGGRNCVLKVAVKEGDVACCPTIIFGADVTHPQPGEDSHSTPSIAAVVASMDWPQVTKYRGLASAQHTRKEIIEDLYNVDKDIHGGMIRDQLLAFCEANEKRKPERIIFYRDGVSEGQFNQVILHEVDAIKKACRSIEESYMPRVTFIVVQKRHHTRLFVHDHIGAGLIDKSGNIVAGTMVDDKICHPTEFDFYLCSHGGARGTSRPAHYHVLYDDNGFSADAVQLLTYNLCYTYVRCNRSVSVVPPVYYAHLLARRARHYIEGDDARTRRLAPESRGSSSTSTSTSTGTSTSTVTGENENFISSLCRIKDFIISSTSAILGEKKKKKDIPIMPKIKDCNSTMKDKSKEIIPTLPRIKDSIKDLMFFI